MRYLASFGHDDNVLVGEVGFENVRHTSTGELHMLGLPCTLVLEIIPIGTTEPSGELHKLSFWFSTFAITAVLRQDIQAIKGQEPYMHPKLDKTNCGYKGVGHMVRTSTMPKPLALKPRFELKCFKMTAPSGEFTPTKGGKKPLDTSWEKCRMLPWKHVEAVPLSYAKAIHDASGSRVVLNEDGTVVRKKWSTYPSYTTRES
eukprot:jgi/Tetstr1/443106/TSEL_031162.t1